MSEWKKENITRVPAQILFQKGGGFLYFNLIFQGLDIVGAFMKKSEEYFLGIYNGSTYVGYLHFGKIPQKKHAEIINEILPKNKNQLDEFHLKFLDKIEYHLSTSDAFRFIGELDKRIIIEKQK